MPRVDYQSATANRSAERVTETGVLLKKLYGGWKRRRGKTIKYNGRRMTIQLQLTQPDVAINTATNSEIYGYCADVHFCRSIVSVMDVHSFGWIRSRILSHFTDAIPIISRDVRMGRSDLALVDPCRRLKIWEGQMVTRMETRQLRSWMFSTKD